jgi:carbamoylphosphate synthase large subunit
MSNYLLYAAESSVTGRELLDRLKEDGVDIRGGSRIPEGEVGTLIRWGATSPIARRPHKVLNQMKAIQAASNKREALKALRAANINVPIVIEADEILQDKGLAWPVLGRKDRHVGANDIVLCLQGRDVERAKAEGCTHFSKYIPTAAEYRVHVFADNIIKTSQKVLTEPDKATQPWVRNLGSGYTFRQPETRLSGGARGMAIDAVNALGLTFGAVDLIVGDDDEAYVLEVNTAPGLQTDTSLDAYLEQFKRAIN